MLEGGRAGGREGESGGWRFMHSTRWTQQPTRGSDRGRQEHRVKELEETLERTEARLATQTKLLEVRLQVDCATVVQG